MICAVKHKSTSLSISTGPPISRPASPIDFLNHGLQRFAFSFNQTVVLRDAFLIVVDCGKRALPIADESLSFTCIVIRIG